MNVLCLCGIHEHKIICPDRTGCFGKSLKYVPGISGNQADPIPDLKFGKVLPGSSNTFLIFFDRCDLAGIRGKGCHYQSRKPGRGSHFQDAPGLLNFENYLKKTDHFMTYDRDPSGNRSLFQGSKLRIPVCIKCIDEC